MISECPILKDINRSTEFISIDIVHIKKIFLYLQKKVQKKNNYHQMDIFRIDHIYPKVLLNLCLIDIL